MKMINKTAALVLGVLFAFSAGVFAPIDDAQARDYTKTHAKKHYKSHVKKHSGYKSNRRVKRTAKKHRATHRSASKSRHTHRRSRKHSRSDASFRRHRMNLGAMATTHTRRAHAPARTSGGVRWSASQGCLNASLRGVIYQVASKFGSVRVNSTCRSSARNRRAGGARRSHHLSGNAVDFRVSGNVRAVSAYLRSHGSVGGIKHYGGGRFHIDTGQRRSW